MLAFYTEVSFAKRFHKYVKGKAILIKVSQLKQLH